MDSKEAFLSMLSKGLHVDKDRYCRLDSLASNADWSSLFDVLQAHKDFKGNSAIFTGFCIVANPDFKKIRENDFIEYNYEPFTETLKRYPAHNLVPDLIQEGIQKRLFHPEFHGREHLNIKRWMKALRMGNKATRIAFDHNVSGINFRVSNEIKTVYQAAFDVDDIYDTKEQSDILIDGLKLFKNTFGHNAKFFVPPNYRLNNSLNGILSGNGIQFINSGKIATQPLGKGKMKRSIRYMGMPTGIENQLYMTRNCVFEPSSHQKSDWINSCLKEIEAAFRWKKPAIVSTHRVNYVGYLDKNNRTNGLKSLDELLLRIIQKWPNVEFLSSTQTANLILKDRMNA